MLYGVAELTDLRDGRKTRNCIKAGAVLAKVLLKIIELVEPYKVGGRLQADNESLGIQFGDPV